MWGWVVCCVCVCVGGGEGGGGGGEGGREGERIIDKLQKVQTFLKKKMISYFFF